MPDPRYARQVLLPGFGDAGQRRLQEARVVVIGAGGLGCALLPVLSASGVGDVVVVDDDVVEATNLHRQVLFGPGDLGRPKARVAAERLAALGGRASAVLERLTEANAAALIAGADLVVDATDDLDARYLLDDATAAAGIPLVWGSAVGFTGQVGVALAGGPRWRDLFPLRPAPGTVATCELVGVLPSLCTTVGGAMATEALKLLTGIGRPLAGRVLVFDAAAATVRGIAYGAADDHGPVGDRDENEGTMADIEEITPSEAAELLRSGGDVTLLDVREPWEAEIASLPGAVLIPLGELPDRIGELDPDREVIAYCHAGVRSLRAAGVLQQAGLKVKSVAGGIDEWSRTVDPDVPRY
ncbi:ThiF family adenylyltransferase [uncultured Amnibacterium sp.]|uniref:ThiF family adenylyltransferase n=1 Tax=uncultured Amnibacterium sp. TaxID=1631851 RepID=UPI0035CAC2E2